MLTIIVGSGGIGSPVTGSWGGDPVPAGGNGGSTSVRRGISPILNANGGSGGAGNNAIAECSTAAGAGYMGGNGANNWQGAGGAIGVHASGGGKAANAFAPGAGGAGGDAGGQTCYLGFGGAPALGMELQVQLT